MEDLGRIAAFLERDHDEIDDLFEKYRDAKHRGDRASEAAFREFDVRLRRHIDWEEDVLFPVFEQRKEGQMQRGPTILMRHEHEQIRMYLDLIADALKSGSSPRTYENALLTTLQEHNEKEEGILYPWFDRELTEEETEYVLRKLKRAGAEESRA